VFKTLLRKLSHKFGPEALSSLYLKLTRNDGTCIGSYATRNTASRLKFIYVSMVKVKVVPLPK